MRDGLMSAVLIVAMAVAVGMAITLSIGIVIMTGGGTNRSGRGVGSFETPGHELTALPIIDFSFWSTPDSNYSRVVLPEVTLHAFVDTHTAEKDQRQQKNDEAQGAFQHMDFGLKLGVWNLFK